MVVGCSSREFPDHKDPPFSKSKAYHSEVKPDTATLKLEVKWHWKVYFSTTHQPQLVGPCVLAKSSNPYVRERRFGFFGV